MTKWLVQTEDIKIIMYTHLIELENTWNKNDRKKGRKGQSTELKTDRRTRQKKKIYIKVIEDQPWPSWYLYNNTPNNCRIQILCKSTWYIHQAILGHKLTMIF